jgi:SAM-dependent methyltransferase
MGDESELDAIRDRYARRRFGDRYALAHADVYMRAQERERAMLRWISRSELEPRSEIRLLDVGCGSGADLLWFIRAGFDPGKLIGNELRADAAAAARYRLPTATRVIVGDAAALDLPDASLDVVFQSVMFSSILDGGLQQSVADRMWRLVRRDGGVLWYDFLYDNPWNPDVRGVPLRRVRALFPHGILKIIWRLTLAPPVGRVVTRLHPALYTVLNVIPRLRTHVLCWIVKP